MSRSALRESIVNAVRSLKPGWAYSVDGLELDMLFPAYEYNGAMFRAPDQVLEKIVGSMWEFYYLESPRGSVTFYRANQVSETPLYTSPDRR